MVTFAKKIWVKNILWSQLIVSDGKLAKFDSAGRNMLFFLQVPFKPLNQQHRLKIQGRWFNGLYVTRVFIFYKTWLFQSVSAIFNNILCLVKWLFIPKIRNTWIFCIILDPCTQISMELNSFDHFWTVLKNPKMRPCWQSNQGECSDRLLGEFYVLRILQNLSFLIRKCKDTSCSVFFLSKHFINQSEV